MRKPQLTVPVPDVSSQGRGGRVGAARPTVLVSLFGKQGQGSQELWLPNCISSSQHQGARVGGVFKAHGSCASREMLVFSGLALRSAGWGGSFVPHSVR